MPRKQIERRHDEKTSRWNFPERLAKLRLRSLTLSKRLREFALKHLGNESQYLFLLTLAVGAICGVLAVAFHLSIQFGEKLLIERALHAPGRSWIGWTLLVPTLGGLAAGALLTWVAPGARGSGIPDVKRAFATEGGRIRIRDAVGKFFISSLQIGSGASLGREGPTVHICAGAASLVGRVTSLPPRNLRRLTPVGVAAGIAAAFNAPIAAVTFTIEEIVGALDQTVLSGVVVAAAVAAVIERGILGGHPVIEVYVAYGLDHASSLLHYALLGLVAAVVSVVFTDGLLAVRARFRRMTLLPAWSHPAIGGFVTGALTVSVMLWLGATGVNGAGYATLGRALDGELSLKVLACLGVVKIAATVLSYSSGGAGGIFAPTLFIGAMLGGAVGHLDIATFGHENAELGAFALVGMGAAFAGVIRAPITSVLIIFELTGSYGLILPLMLANMTSYGIAKRLRPTPIYEALLEQDGIRLPDGPRPNALPLEAIRVEDVMTRDVAKLEIDTSATNAKALAKARGVSTMPVVDALGSVRGTISVEQLLSNPNASVEELVRPALVAHSDEPLVRAIVRMTDANARQLVVISPETHHVVGMLAMSDVARRHSRALSREDESDVSRNSDALVERSEVTAENLMLGATLIDRAVKLPELVTLSLTTGESAFVVEEGDGSFSVLLPEHLTEFARDEVLERMLIAADVARPARAIHADADLETMTALLGSPLEEVAVVLDSSNTPIGVLSRKRLAEAALERLFHRRR